MIIKNKITPRELEYLRLVSKVYEKKYSAAAVYNKDGGSEIDNNFRQSETLFISQSSNAYQRVSNICYSYVIEKYCNALFNPSIYLPEIQFAKYTKHGVFKWHKDNIGDYNPTRVLTMSINLSDPKDYEGGELKVKFLDEEHVLNKEPGSFIIFPSFLMHQACEIISGTRNCLVVWTYADKKYLELYRNEFRKLQDAKSINKA